MYSLSKTKLLFDLYYAFQCAKKHKASKEYVKVFERNLYENLVELRDELFERRYKPQPIAHIYNNYHKENRFNA